MSLYSINMKAALLLSESMTLWGRILDLPNHTEETNHGQNLKNIENQILSLTSNIQKLCGSLTVSTEENNDVDQLQEISQEILMTLTRCQLFALNLSDNRNTELISKAQVSHELKRHLFFLQESISNIETKESTNITIILQNLYRKDWE